ncbi:MAG: hypothetical protein LQ352_001495 [Teloschistes flavicans]|nr:MAG: hypothetical protein LQ352_001495 [Teloschistes flavicans]
MSPLKNQSLSFLLCILTTAQLSIANPPLDPNSTVADCSCYKAPGNEKAIFLNHQFFDFRTLDNAIAASNLTAPALIDNDQGAGIEPITSPFFGKGFFGDYFTPASWSKNASESAPVRLVNSQQNIYLARDVPGSPIHLTLRTNRLESFQSTSDLETTELAYLFASIRIRARVTGSSGACAGMFFYHSDEQESDIEILTRDEHNDSQGNIIPEASTQVPIPEPDSAANGSWTDWNEYQLDWLSGRSEWLINGISKLNKTYSVPSQASNFQLKIWSDGSTWPGNMTVGGLATLDVEWIDIVYNTSQEAAGASCKKVCSVDSIATSAVPQVAWGNLTAARVGIIPAILVGLMWVAVLF